MEICVPRCSKPSAFRPTRGYPPTSTPLTTQQGWLAAAVLISSLMAVIYIGRVAELLYLRPAPDNVPAPREAPAAMLAATWTLVLVNIGLGLYSTPIVDVARSAATGLTGGGT